MKRHAKVDLRVLKTEQALVDAMQRLLEETPIEAITVSDLCDEAMIRRATFYKHFKDKYDFLDFCLQKKQAKLQEDFSAEGCHPLDGYMTAVQGMLHYLRENQSLIERCGKQSEFDTLMSLFARQLSRNLTSREAQLMAQGKRFGAPPEIMANYFTGALLGVARWWLMEETQSVTEEALLGYLRQMAATSMQHMIIEDYEEGNNERKSAKEQ